MDSEGGNVGDEKDNSDPADDSEIVMGEDGRRPQNGRVEASSFTSS